MIWELVGSPKECLLQGGSLVPLHHPLGHMDGMGGQAVWRMEENGPFCPTTVKGGQMLWNQAVGS